MKINSEDRIEIVSGASVSLAFRIIGILTGYIFFFLISRMYGAEALGIWALSFTVLQLSAFLSKIGLGRALLKYVSSYTSIDNFSAAWLIYKKSLKILLSLSVLIGIAVITFSTQISIKVFSKPEMSPAIILVGLVLPFFVVLSVNAECIRGLRNIKVFSFLTTLSEYIVPVVVLGILYLFFRSKYVPIFATGIGIIIAFIYSMIYWLRSRPDKMTGSPSNISYKKILNTAFPMLLSGSIFIVTRWINTFMIGVYDTTADVGLYNVALKIANLVSIPTLAITTIAAPKFAQFYTKGKLEKLRENIDYSGKLIFYFSLPILIIILLFSSQFLKIFGGEFLIAQNALLVILISQFINIITGAVGFILQMTGKEKEYSLVRIIELAIIIGMNIWLIPLYGYLGAAISSLISGFIRNFASLFLVRKYYGINTLIFFRLRGAGY